jgi:diguanylate cyclase (GGDEF)-like protein/PAS domain S-box-containing protein
MTSKSMTYLQFKSTADTLALTHHNINPEDLFNVLSEITTREQINEYYTRWSAEKVAQSSTENKNLDENSLRAKELEKSLSITRATLESTADAILIINKDGKIADFNQKFLEVTEVPKEIIESGEENAGLGYLLGLLKDPQELIAQMQYLMMHPDKDGDMGDVHFKNGKIVERYSQPHRIGSEIVGRVWSFRDVTEKRKQEESLRLANRAIDSSTHGIILVENNGNFPTTYLNPASSKLLQLNESEALRKPFLTLSDAFTQHAENFLDILREKHTGTLTIQCHTGNKIAWLEINIDPVFGKTDQSITHFVIIINDITKNKELENILQYKTVHDSLTGLPNKAYMEDAIRYQIKKSIKQNEKFGVLFIDIDRFKNINDTLGHHIGDNLLCLFGKRVQNMLKKSDIIARIGGDEFIVLINGIHNIDDLSIVANRLIESSRQTFTSDDHEFNITISIGVVFYPECGRDPETLIRNADIAMYQSKKNGRNQYSIYDASLNQVITRRVQIENELHGAIENNEFQLVYQPIYNIKEGKFTKAETLIRWKNKKLGDVPPNEFIPVVEDIGMISTVGRWIIETAMRQILTWQNTPLKNLTLSINVSAKQLSDENFIKHLNETIEKNNIATHKILFEITESFFLLQEKVTNTLSNLNNLGVKIAIDDFGTGYSNLSYLNKLNIHSLKIDKSFIDQIDSPVFDESVLQTIIAIAKRMHYKLIAEGVETEKQFLFLKENECDEIQGYYFSKPLTVVDFEKFISKADETNKEK